jgi:hypothetical protein
MRSGPVSGQHNWSETYSDRGGNLPYWLNGVIPLAFQLREEADRVDATGYNLTHVIVTYMHALLANQRDGRYGDDGLDANFNLGTWNVVRSCLLYMSARPAVVADFAPFVVGYVRAAQRQLLAKGWAPDSLSNRLCTETDQAHPHGGSVPGGASHCAVRYPDWSAPRGPAAPAPLPPPSPAPQAHTHPGETDRCAAPAAQCGCCRRLWTAGRRFA